MAIAFKSRISDLLSVPDCRTLLTATLLIEHDLSAFHSFLMPFLGIVFVISWLKIQSFRLIASLRDD